MVPKKEMGGGLIQRKGLMFILRRERGNLKGGANKKRKKFISQEGRVPPWTAKGFVK